MSDRPIAKIEFTALRFSKNFKRSTPEPVGALCDFAQIARPIFDGSIKGSNLVVGIKPRIEEMLPSCSANTKFKVSEFG
jgi:hypothetical protein